MKLDAGWGTYESAGQTIPAFFARPAGARAPLPAVLVIHEVFGVEDHIEDVTRRFATAGYDALAPDLWSAGGERPEAITRERVASLRAFLNANPSAWAGGEAREKALGRVAEAERQKLAGTAARLFGSDEGRAERFARYTEIVRGAVSYLSGQAGAPVASEAVAPARATSGTTTEGRKIGCVGFCMGGGISGALACAEPLLSAAVVFYGSPPPAEKVSGVGCPVLGHYADPDPRITPLLPAFAEAMKANGKSFEHHVYPRAPHAFFNDTTGAYRVDAARLAWARTLSFFARYLP